MENGEDGKKIVVGERTDGAITVKLLSCPTADPYEMASHAASICYEGKTPEMGVKKDVEKTLFLPGHHTTAEHPSYEFLIDRIAVGDVTFGMHLTHPFYNSDQRSGRFCSDMFENPDYTKLIGTYISTYWKELSNDTVQGLVAYVQSAVEMYNSKLKEAEAKALELLLIERPFATEKEKENSVKLAREQLRAFIPIIFPSECNPATSPAPSNPNPTRPSCMFHLTWGAVEFSRRAAPQSLQKRVAIR